jgi:hypothetical protein
VKITAKSAVIDAGMDQPGKLSSLLGMTAEISFPAGGFDVEAE